MKGAEIAARTLNQERISEPCISGPWIMKGSYYSKVTGLDYWENKDDVFLRSLPVLGVNLCPQWAIPYDEDGNAGVVGRIGESWSNRLGIREPEEILPLIDQLPDDEQVERDFDVEAYAAKYAADIKNHMAATGGEVLFLDGFGQADFMGPYNDWGYTSYLMAMALYPAHIQRYFHYTASLAYWQNTAIVESVRKYGLINYVFGGQDICTNHGPICSVAKLDELYFPELTRAIQPLIANDIRIIWHCDGNIMPILARLISLGIWGLQGFQEEYGVQYEQIVQRKSIWGKPLIIWGCVSVTTTLPFGSASEVKAAVRRSYQLAGPGRGFCLAPTSSVMPEVSDETIELFFSYGKTFGKEYLAANL